jgi:hypothetical protein
LLPQNAEHPTAAAMIKPKATLFITNPDMFLVRALPGRFHR